MAEKSISIPVKTWLIQNEYVDVYESLTNRSYNIIALDKTADSRILFGENVVHTVSQGVYNFTGNFIYSHGDFTGTITGFAKEYETSSREEFVDFGDGEIKVLHKTSNVRHTFVLPGGEEKSFPVHLTKQSIENNLLAYNFGDTKIVFTKRVQGTMPSGGCGCGS